MSAVTTVNNEQASLALNYAMGIYGIYPTNGSAGEEPSLGYVAAIKLFAFGSSRGNPDLTDGQLVLIEDQEVLYNLIGTTYGGDGQTNFAYPNFDGDVLVGKGSVLPAGASQLGSSFGERETTVGSTNYPVALGGQGQPFSNYQPSETTNYLIAVRDGYDIFAGAVQAFAADVTPNGYLPADGRLLAISQFPDLFDAIGTRYGGDGATTFALPDLRGRAIIGDDLSTTVGQYVGSPTVTLTQATTPSAAGGESQAFANGQPAVVMNYLIALRGAFPPHDVPLAGAQSRILGEIVAYAGEYIPSGYVRADGSLLQISQHTALFALLGTTFGGDGVRTFALPDLRGRVVIDAGGDFEFGRGIAADTIAPGVPTLTGLVAGSQIADNTPTLGGVAEAHATVSVKVDGAVVGQAIASNAGIWSFTLQAPLSEGNHTFQIYATDEYKNKSIESDAVTVRIEAIDNAPVLSGSGLVVSERAKGQSFTVSKTQLLQGYADPEGNTLSVGGVAADHGSVVENGDGTYTITPDATYSGRLKVSYSVLDGAISTDASVFVTINKLVNGGSGNDLLIATATADDFRGFQGVDTVSYANALDLVVASLADAAGNSGAAAGDTYSGIENLVGSAYADTLTGDSHANVLNGSLGADTLTGGAGNDTYFVDDIGDVVVEDDQGGGTLDIIQSSISYTLTDTQFIETLRLVNSTGDADLNLTGNRFANRLIGNGGDNVLDGGAGADRLEGGAGDDTYHVDNARDVVIEFVNGGNDTVLVDTGLLSYALQATREVETLRAEDLSATTALKLYGNSFANTLIGNVGDNVLNGRGGGDILIGGAGNDTYYASSGDGIVEVSGQGGGNDSLIALTSYTLNESAAVETLRLVSTLGNGSSLTGNEFDQRLVGNAGSNALDGGLGNDILQGGTGADTFQFSTELGASNVDHIRDFAPGQDTINFIPDGSVMLPSDGTGRMAESGFAVITNGTSDVTADTRILYNKTTGALFYDADGSGSTEAVQFAILDNRAGISAHDFLVG